MTFNGFISYSHAADGRLAPAVQRGLHRLAKPWHRRRALWIFRDQTGLAVTPGLWSAIQSAMDGSEYFVLLASPEAARSPWVNREIEHWIATKSADRILPVVTEGEWAWDPHRGDFAEDSTAVPPALHGVFTEEPFFLDLRWARGSEQLTLQHSRFRDAIAQLAAPMHGVSTDELEGEDVRQHRRVRRLRSGAVATLVVLALLASLTGLSAVRNSERAKASLAEALRQERVANGQRDLADQAAAEALRQGDLAQLQQDRAAKAADEAEESERLAREQQKLADQAAAEARRQQRLADLATNRTQKQQQLAKEAAGLARREKKEAERLALIAAEQRRLAGEAAKEAAKQQRIAVSRRLMNQANATVGDDPKTALMLGAAAEELNPDPVTRGQLAGVVTATTYAGSIGEVGSAEYGPDGTLVTAGTDGRVSLWNVTDPTRPARIATLADKGATEQSVKISKDGRTLGMVNANGQAVLWDIANRSRPVRLATLQTASSVTAMDFSPDGITFATGEANEARTLWDTTDRTRPAQLWTEGAAEPDPHPMPGSGPYPVNTLTFSPNGRMLIVRKTGPAPVYDVTDRANPVRIGLGSIGSISGPLAFSPDGSRLAVAGGDRIASSVSIYPVTYPAPGAALRPVARDTQLPIPPYWPSPPPMPPMPEPDPEDTGSEGLGTERLDGLDYVPTAVAFSSDGRLLAGGDKRGTAMVWDLNARPGSLHLTKVHTRSPIAEVSFDPDGKTLLTVETSGTATLWNVTPHSAPDPLDTLTGPNGWDRATAFSPDGRSLVAAGSAGTAGTWNTTDPRHPVRGTDLALHSQEVRAVAFSPDLRTVATVAAASGELALADTARPALRTTLTTLPHSPGETMLFSPDGRTLAVLPDPTTVLLWDVADRARPALLGKLKSTVFAWAMAFSPDGRVLAVAGNDAKITLWNVADRSAPVRLGTLIGHSSVVESIAFSPNGRYLASGSDDGATLWDVTDRLRPARLAILPGTSSAVQAVGFSPDGRTLAAVMADSWVILWGATEPAGPVQLARVRDVSGRFLTSHELVFRRDGRTLAVTGQVLGETMTVTLWDYQKVNSLRADPAEQACAIVGRGLSAGEWSRYIPEIRYRRTCAK